MVRKNPSKLDPKKRYLQVALNSTLEEARKIIAALPRNDRIIIEAGTPLIKRYGTEAISDLADWWGARLSGSLLLGGTRSASPTPPTSIFDLWKLLTSGTVSKATAPKEPTGTLHPYVVADLKTMDRGQTEVEIAARAGASAAIALGTAPAETLNAFLDACAQFGLDAMIDMMHVDYPLSVLRTLKAPPHVVILHRGVDEERFNREKQIPLHEIRRIKGNYDIMISIAGGDTIREVQRSIFNDADIVVVWKAVYQSTADTIALVEGFLKEIK